MSLVTWIAIGVIVLVAIGLGVGVVFSGLVRGAQMVSQNPVVKNATSETGKALSNVTGTATLFATTTVQPEKTSFASSEPVVIVLKNQGTQTVVFPSHAPVLKIKNQNGDTRIVNASMDKDHIAPGGSTMITWDQRDSSGNLVGPGTYTLVVVDDSDNVGTTTVTIQ